MNPRREHLRKTIIRLASRRQRPGAGTGSEPLRRKSAMVTWPDLEGVFADVPWATVGGVATRHYMQERATEDLDILVAATAARRARERLAQAGYQYLQELSAGGSSWRSPEGIVIDVLESNEPWIGPALAEAQQNRDLQGLPVLPLPYLVLTKFRSGRVQDLADLTRMLGLAEENVLDRVRQIVGEFEPDALEDLESLIALGRLETDDGEK